MHLSQEMLNRIFTRNPGQRARRVILDPDGNHHRVPPSKDLRHAAAIHRHQSNLDVAESLYIVRQLRQLGAVGPNTIPQGRGAVVQAFRGTDGKEPLSPRGCHTMPCQLVLDSRFPHQLRAPDPSGKMRPMRGNYIRRTIDLFSRCTYSPNIVNRVDQLLDWNEASDFIYMYMDAVRGVLQGKDPNAMYADFADKRALVMESLLGRQQLTIHEATVLIGAVSMEPGGWSPVNESQVDTVLRDRELLTQLDDYREAVIEQYRECDRTLPLPVTSGQLQETVVKESETWVKKAESPTPGAA